MSHVFNLVKSKKISKSLKMAGKAKKPFWHRKNEKYGISSVYYTENKGIKSHAKNILS